MLRTISLLAYLVGLFGRYIYIQRLHNPRNHIYTDVTQYLDFAHRLLDPHYQQTIHDSVWPPGTSIFLAVQYLLDPTLNVAAWTSLALTGIVPILIAYAAYLAWGSRACWYALIASSFHFGFVHYGGFFLSENLFTFLVSLALCLFTLSVYRIGGFISFWAGLLAGCAWGVAYGVRAPALPIGLAILTLVTLHAVKSKQLRNIKYLICPTIGFLIIAIPLALRCTTLSSGKVCLVSNNFAMNIALGYAGEHAALKFAGPNGEFPMTWGPPSKIMHDFKSTGQVPTHIFDTGGVLKWVGEQVVNNPIDSLVSSLGNVFDLFNPYFFWPGGPEQLPSRWIWVMQQLFLFVVLIPALTATWRYSKETLIKDETSIYGVYLVAGVLGLLAISFFSMGEPRYRIPLDGFFILLAVSWVVREPAQERGAINALLAVLGLGTAAWGLAHILLLYPNNPIRPGLLNANKLGPTPKTWVQKVAKLEDFQNGPTSGFWKAPGTTVFECHIDCPEVIILPSEQGFGEKFLISVDHNDRYAIRFYKDKKILLQITVGPSPSRPRGLATEYFELPSKIKASEVTQIGVIPLYGDGKYSFGAFRSIPSTEPSQASKMPN